MKQYEAVIKVMKESGGYATLGYLYRTVLNVPDVIWNTKTPYASIRRIVQDQRFFFKIKPGLWALNSHRESVLDHFSIGTDSTEKQHQEFDHTYYQGLLVEVGNTKHYQTFVPHQDKNRLYLSKPLGHYSTVEDYYQFTYDHILKRASTIDVTWFNERCFPESLFEVEHTTDIQNSLLKFNELQDFQVKFAIVASKDRFREFTAKLTYEAFRNIKNRVQFINYEELSSYHSKAFELEIVQRSLSL